MKDTYWKFIQSDSPIVATAVHSGSHLPSEFQPFMALTDKQRRYEEDPYTDLWTQITSSRVVVHLSRYCIDLNRPREKAFYLSEGSSWGLNAWSPLPDQKLIDLAFNYYDQFYTEAYQYFTKLEKKFGNFVVFDLHSFNPTRPEGKNFFTLNKTEIIPDINLGTGTMDRQLCSNIVEFFLDTIEKQRFRECPLRIMENAIFAGGHFPRWIHQNFPTSACVLSIEINKSLFMNVDTEQLDQKAHTELGKILKASIPPLLKKMEETYA